MKGFWAVLSLRARYDPSIEVDQDPYKSENRSGKRIEHHARLDKESLAKVRRVSAKGFGIFRILRFGFKVQGRGSGFRIEELRLRS